MIVVVLFCRVDFLSAGVYLIVLLCCIDFVCALHDRRVVVVLILCVFAQSAACVDLPTAPHHPLHEGPVLRAGGVAVRAHKEIDVRP